MSKVQASQYELRGDPFDKDTFVPSARTGLNPHRVAGIDNWRAKNRINSSLAAPSTGGAATLILIRVAVNAHTLCGGGFRLDMNGEDRSGFGVLHDQRVHP